MDSAFSHGLDMGLTTIARLCSPDCFGDTDPENGTAILSAYPKWLYPVRVLLRLCPALSACPVQVLEIDARPLPYMLSSRDVLDAMLISSLKGSTNNLSMPLQRRDYIMGSGLTLHFAFMYHPRIYYDLP
jgi:hypothetical protein